MWPCPKARDLNNARIHFSRCQQMSDFRTPLMSGLESVIIHTMQTRTDIAIAFQAERVYGVALMKIRDFLELEYQVRCDIHNSFIRDRVWLQKFVNNLDELCLVPKECVIEFNKIREFKNRCEAQKIKTLNFSVN